MVYRETQLAGLQRSRGILKKHLKLNAQWIPKGRGGYSYIFIYEGLAHFSILGDLKF